VNEETLAHCGAIAPKENKKEKIEIISQITLSGRQVVMRTVKQD